MLVPVLRWSGQVTPRPCMGVPSDTPLGSTPRRLHGDFPQTPGWGAPLVPLRRVKKFISSFWAPTFLSRLSEGWGLGAPLLPSPKAPILLRPLGGQSPARPPEGRGLPVLGSGADIPGSPSAGAPGLPPDPGPFTS